MVGLATEPEDMFMLLGLVVLTPLLLVFGIGILLSVLGAKWWVVLIVTLLNIGGAIFLLHHWELLDSLQTAINDFMTP